MGNNDVLRRLRYALGHSDTPMLDLFARAGCQGPGISIAASSGKPIARPAFRA